MTSAQENDGAATPSPNAADRIETCDACDEETSHDVSVRIWTESEGAENAAYSREPYRVTECRACGATTSERLNDR